MLTHIGRNSGKPRRVVLEVMKNDAESGIFYIGSGWGEKSNWLLNIQKTPEVNVHVGNSVFGAVADRLSINEGFEILLDYALRNPKAFKMLAVRLILGKELDISEQSASILAEHISIVALRPIG